MVDSQTYIKANTPTVVENYINHLLWNQQPLNEYLQEIEAHVREYRYCDADEFKASILRLLRQLTTEDKLLKFAKQRKALVIRPYYSTVKKYIEGQWETSLEPEIIADLIKQVVSKF
jgi:hypothetical protein